MTTEPFTHYLESLTYFETYRRKPLETPIHPTMQAVPKLDTATPEECRTDPHVKLRAQWNALTCEQVVDGIPFRKDSEGKWFAVEFEGFIGGWVKAQPLWKRGLEYRLTPATHEQANRATIAEAKATGAPLMCKNEKTGFEFQVLDEPTRPERDYLTYFIKKPAEPLTPADTVHIPKPAEPSLRERNEAVFAEHDPNAHVLQCRDVDSENEWSDWDLDYDPKKEDWEETEFRNRPLTTKELAARWNSGTATETPRARVIDGVRCTYDIRRGEGEWDSNNPPFKPIFNSGFTYRIRPETPEEVVQDYRALPPDEKPKWRLEWAHIGVGDWKVCKSPFVESLNMDGLELRIVPTAPAYAPWTKPEEAIGKVVRRKPRTDEAWQIVGAHNYGRSSLTLVLVNGGEVSAQTLFDHYEQTTGLPCGTLVEGRAE